MALRGERTMSKLALNKKTISGVFVMGIIVFLYILTENIGTFQILSHAGIADNPVTGNPASVRSPQAWYRDPDGKSWQPRKVLIFAYGRSGSSLTGHLLRHSPGVYFVYEPLMSLAKEKDGQKRKQGHQAIMQALYHCNFSIAAVRLLRGNFHMNRYAESSMILKCLKKQGKEVAKETPQKCLKAAEQVCRAHPVKAIKVIRMSMEEVRDLMTLNPDLAVIVLMRDPRARLWSVMKVFEDSQTLQTLLPVARNVCQSTMADLKLAQDLFRQHPAKLRFLRYEDLALDMMKVTRNMYDFLRLNWTATVASAVAKHVSNRASGSPTDNSVPFVQSKSFVMKKAYTLVRENASLAAARWKIDIPLSVLRTVERECSEVLTLLGYRKFFQSLPQQAEEQLGVRADILSFRLVEELSYKGDLNY